MRAIVRTTLTGAVLVASTTIWSSRACAEEINRAETVAVAVGYSVRRLFDIPVHAGDLSIAAGKQWRHVGVFFVLDGLTARTPAGLRIVQVDAGCAVEWRLARLHLGIDFHTGYFQIDRVTSTQPAQGGFSGFRPYVAVDAIDFGRGAFLFLRARLDLDVVAQAPFWGGTFSAGLRL
jgi:hypothetical protein